MASVELSITEGVTTTLDLSVPGVQGPPGPGVPSGGTTNQVLIKQSSGNYDATWGAVTSAIIGNLTIVDEDISASAAIVDTKLSTIVSAGKVANSATSASTAASSNTIVLRNGSGGIAVAHVTADGATINGNAQVSGLTVLGNLTVSGTTTTVNSTDLVIKDKNIELGSVSSPSDVLADGGGITLKGTTDKTITWLDASDSWTLSENLDLATGKTYRINNVEVLSASGLGSAVQIGAANVPSGIITSTMITDGTIVDADINASAAVALSKLATGALPSGITIASSNLVDGTIVNADINASAAIELSKLATGALPSGITVASSNLVDGTIVNVDIASNAAIALTKLADGTLPSGIAIASGTQASTNLAYDTSTRALSSSTGSGITVPLFTTSIAGLQPASSFSTIAYASGIELDMAVLDQQYRTITMSGDLSLTTSNLANGRTVSLRLIASGATRALTVPSGWLFLGAKPTTVASGKTAVLSLTMFGSVDADCIAAYGVQA